MRRLNQLYKQALAVMISGSLIALMLSIPAVQAAPKKPVCKAPKGWVATYNPQTQHCSIRKK